MTSALVLDKISKRFAGRIALADVSIEIAQSELVVLLGANGAGKTTLLRIVAGYLRADAGRVVVNGRAVDPDDPVTRLAIGYLPETVPLYGEMRVRSFLSFAASIRGIGRKEVATRVDTAIALAGLGQVAERPIAALSRGYRQRVGLAQAIAHDPAVLILDEPTSALDPEQIHEARELLKSLARERAVVVSTHLLVEAAKIADRVVVLHDGRVAATGPPDSLSGPRRAVVALVRAPADDLAAAARRRGWRLVPQSEGLHRLEAADAEASEVARWVVQRGWDLVQLSPGGTTLEDAYLAVITEARTPRG